MSKLETMAEMIKLARLLGLERHAIGYMSTLPASEIKRLREAAVHKTFTREHVLFERLAKASRLLPANLAARLSEQVFGATLTARIAGEMPTDRAVKIAGHLSTPFMADVATELEPAAAKHIIRAMPAEQVRDVAVELLRRGEFVTMGRFVGYLSDKTLRTVLEAVDDDEALLHIGFFTESKAQLNQVVVLLSDERLRHIVQIAQSRPTELWPEALGLMAHIDDSLKGRLGDLTAEQDESMLASLARIAHEQSLWDDVLPIVACMSEENQTKLMRLPVLRETAVMEGILRAADENRLWQALLPQIERMSTNQLQTMAELATSLPETAQERIIAAARAADLWDELFDIVASLSASKRRSLESIIQRFARTDRRLVDELADRARRHGLDDLLEMARGAAKAES